MTEEPWYNGLQQRFHTQWALEAARYEEAMSEMQMRIGGSLLPRPWIRDKLRRWTDDRHRALHQDFQREVVRRRYRDALIVPRFTETVPEHSAGPAEARHDGIFVEASLPHLFTAAVTRPASPSA